jgi:mono/diheme cytochrome c family protein
MRWVKWGLFGALGLLILIQLVPYGRDHENPAVVTEPSWDSQQTRDLAVRACFDCHSNETTWPWYSNIAPLSWLIQRDVDEGREHLNFSEWNRRQRSGESAETVREGEMPPNYYTVTHPNARLSDAEMQALAQGLTASLP